MSRFCCCRISNSTLQRVILEAHAEASTLTGFHQHDGDLPHERMLASTYGLVIGDADGCSQNFFSLEQYATTGREAADIPLR